MVLTLSLVRHGQTKFNAESRMQGRCDSPLTARGLTEARTTAAHLAAHQFTAAYVSSSGRAQATASEILVHHPGSLVVTDQDLREFCFGDLEARPEAEMRARYDADTLYSEVLLGTFAGISGGGERGSDYLARVWSAFARIEQSHPHGHVLVVSHGLTLAAYLTMIGSRPTAPLPNASVSVVEVHPDGRRRAIAVGLDLAHAGGPDMLGAVTVPALAV